MSSGLHENNRYSCQISVKLEFFEIFEKNLIKFHENSSSGGRVVPCGRTDTHDEVIFAFRNFSKAPKTV